MTTRLFRRFGLLFLTLLLLLPGGLTVRSAVPKARALTYTALGDSISTGYRLSSKSDSYVSLFGGYLYTTPVNLGQNGLASAGLLKKLTNDSKVIAQVKKSDIITVSMGGNDLLTVLSSFQTQFGSSDTLLEKVKDVQSALKTLQSAEMQQKLTAGVSGFRNNWTRIIARLHTLAPGAVIVVTTLINPYDGIVLDVPLLPKFDLGAYTDPYVRQINSVITGDAQGNYLVADAYSAFQEYTGSGRLTNANLGKFDFDPHPNITGHSLIAAVNEAVGIRLTRGALRLEGPGSVIIPPFSGSAFARYTAHPLLTCFTRSSNTPVIAYSVADAGSTGASVNSATGELTVKKPGTVKIRAVLTLPQANLSAETEITVRAADALSVRTLVEFGVPVLAGLAVLALALLLILRRRRMAGRRRRP